MRLISFDKDGRSALGIRRGDEVIDLSIAAPWLPQPLLPLLTAGETAIQQVKAAVARAPARAVVPLDELVYLPTVPHPNKILCLGLNYVDHADESRMEKPPVPVVFVRFATTLVGHRQPLIRPRCSEQLDYEGELAVIIGKRGRHIPREEALSFVAGYSIFNDGSIRDYQFKTPQWTMGKNFDGTGGFGPECVTSDEVPNGAAGLRIQTRLNGMVMQDANTKDMLFDVATTIEFVSQAVTLQVGDVFVMGTPGGVGCTRKPPVFLKPGDVCEVEIENIGTLVNPVVSESEEDACPLPPTRGGR